MPSRKGSTFSDVMWVLLGLSTVATIIAFVIGSDQPALLWVGLVGVVLTIAFVVVLVREWRGADSRERGE